MCIRDRIKPIWYTLIYTNKPFSTRAAKDIVKCNLNNKIFQLNHYQSQKNNVRPNIAITVNKSVLTSSSLLANWLRLSGTQGPPFHGWGLYRFQKWLVRVEHASHHRSHRACPAWNDSFMLLNGSFHTLSCDNECCTNTPSAVAASRHVISGNLLSKLERSRSLQVPPPRQSYSPGGVTIFALPAVPLCPL